MPNAAQTDIIDLTEVVEEGHPESPNLSSKSRPAPVDETLDDLDLEKEIDQIFAELDSSSTSGMDNREQSVPQDPDTLDLDALFATTAETQSAAQTSASAEAPTHDDGSDIPEDVQESLADPMVAPSRDEEPATDLFDFVETAPATDSGLLEPTKPEPGSERDLQSEQEQALHADTPVVQEPAAAPITSELFDSLLQRMADLETRLARNEGREPVEPDGREPVEPDGDDLLRQLDERIAEAPVIAQIIQNNAKALQDFVNQIQVRIEDAMNDARQRQEELDALGRTIRENRALLDQNAKRMVGFEERLANYFEHILQQKDGLGETIEALIAPKIEHVLGQTAAMQADALDAAKAQLRNELLEEMRRIIPDAAAQIIREEIQALSQEES